MNEKIAEMIKAAKDVGSLTLKQRNFILKTAHNLNEDLSEVEVLLETIPLNINSSSDLEMNSSDGIRKRRTCPNCGAVISDFVLQCPDCGYVFRDESAQSQKTRNIMLELSSALREIDARPEYNIIDNKNRFTIIKNRNEEKISVINSYSVPNTKENLIQAILATYAAYEGAPRISLEERTYGVPDLKSAWLGKCQEFFYLLQSQPEIDTKTAAVIAKYEPLLVKAKKDMDSEKKYMRLIIIAVTLGVVLFYIIIAINAPNI